MPYWYIADHDAIITSVKCFQAYKQWSQKKKEFDELIKNNINQAQTYIFLTP